MKLTKFEKLELIHKVEVLIDSGPEMWHDVNMTEAELDGLVGEIENDTIPDDALPLLLNEAEDLLITAETNLAAGFPEYRNDVRKLRILVKKLEPQ